MSRRLPAVLALAGLALLATACGVPLSPGAQHLSKSGLPAALAGGPSSTTTTSSSTTTTTTPSKTKHRVVVYLLDSTNDRLVAVSRSWPPPISMSTAIGLLVQGPNSHEKQLTTDVAQDASLGVRATSSAIAEVRLDATFGSLSGSQLYLALAQIVYTLMDNFSQLKGVDFQLNGIPYNYTPDGTVDLQPVTMKTYASVGPLPVKRSTSHGH